MKFYSTRNQQQLVSIEYALRQGLADDGGLYVPEHFPKINLADFTHKDNYQQLASKLLSLFFADSTLEKFIPDFCNQAFSFAAPLIELTDNTYILELFHGPTLSFKDFGARFLALCLNQLSAKQPTTLMVATSGDTGSAVAAAMHNQTNVNTIILYPKDNIAKKQKQQITCWGKQVLALAVDASFDDCQKIVKTALNNNPFSSAITTANSINIGRLLPQMTYYAYHSIQFYQQHQTQLNFIVPSGNLGNVTAAFWAKRVGFPIGNIIIATNANRVVSDYLTTGEFQAKASIKTLANAMDIGNPSNFERLNDLFTDFADFTNHTAAITVNDEQIKTSILDSYEQHHYILCPHTACGYFARLQLDKNLPWVIAATASPAKFDEIIEPIIGQPVPIPPALTELMQRDSHFTEVAGKLADIVKVANDYFHSK